MFEIKVLVLKVEKGEKEVCPLQEGSNQRQTNCGDLDIHNNTIKLHIQQI